MENETIKPNRYTFRKGLLLGLITALIVGILTFIYQEKRINQLTKKIDEFRNEELRLPDEFSNRNLKMMEAVKAAKNVGLTTGEVADARDKLLKTEGWNQKEIRKSTQSEMTGNIIAAFSFRYPNDWNLEEKIDENGCGEYFVSKELVGKLKIEVDCKGWAATYYQIPGDAVIVDKVTGTTDDSSVVYVLRFLANSADTYRYVESLVYPPDREIDPVKDKMEDKLFITAPILLDVELTPNDYGSDMEKALLVADTIVNSIERN